MRWTSPWSAARDTPDTATAGTSSLSLPTGVQPASGPSPVENSGSATSTLLTDLIERVKQLRADVQEARTRLEADYDGDGREPDA